jgi:hypothetical protein
MLTRRALHPNTSATVRNPPTGDLVRKPREYRPRQRMCKYFSNTTHGSGWIVQVQPTNECGSIASLNPTHGSGWIVQVQPTNECGSIASLNPTHGSGWIVQVQPTNKCGSIVSLNPTHGSGWIVQVQPTNKCGSIVSLNPTHGSGWIVQVQPTLGAHRDSSFSSPAHPSRRRRERYSKNKGGGRLSL